MAEQLGPAPRTLAELNEYLGETEEQLDVAIAVDDPQAAALAVAAALATVLRYLVRRCQDRGADVQVGELHFDVSDVAGEQLN